MRLHGHKNFVFGSLLQRKSFLCSIAKYFFTENRKVRKYITIGAKATRVAGI